MFGEFVKYLRSRPNFCGRGSGGLENNKVSWINISGLGDIEELRQVGLHFRIHPLAPRDLNGVFNSVFIGLGRCSIPRTHEERSPSRDRYRHK
jgi:hypothetical protein